MNMLGILSNTSVKAEPMLPDEQLLIARHEARCFAAHVHSIVFSIRLQLLLCLDCCEHHSSKGEPSVMYVNWPGCAGSLKTCALTSVFSAC